MMTQDSNSFLKKRTEKPSLNGVPGAVTASVSPSKVFFASFLPIKKKIFLAFACLILAPMTAQAEDTLTPLRWQSQGVFGSYDKAALQRGLLVYQSVCAACHSMNALHYRDLTALGFSTAQAAAFASNVKLADGPATLDDIFKDPAANPANFGGAMPPDMSTLAASRPGGTRYIYNILTSYRDAPADVTLLPGHYYNSAYPGQQIAMPAPLKDDAVSYADGVKASAAQEASDVAAFLTWAAEPNLDESKEIGLRAVLFLVFLTILAIATKRKIWRES
jgi:ubiquinol-cytochrome c reductase cytochrome c1 subunit